MDMECLEYGIVKYGTPLYVFDIDELKETVSLFRRHLGNVAGVCYAMKANPFLTRTMAELADRIEVCSMGEFEICRELQIPPEKLLISGVLKKKEELYEILDYCGGACRYTVESLRQFQNLAEWCDANQKEISIYLRLTSGNQFGVDEKCISNMISLRTMCPFLKIRGIHYFSGTQKKSMEKVKKELEYLDGFLKKLEEAEGYRAEELEYGPGIPISYFDGQEDRLEEDIQMIAETVFRMKWRGNVMLEMGRALVAGCGYYLTSVRDMKQNEGRNYCIVDGGIHQIAYDGQIRGIYRPKIRISPEHTNGKKREYTICGSLCTVNDVLVQKAELVNLRVGSVLVFERAGAYAMTEGMSLFLSHELPQAACYSRDTGWKLIRKECKTYEWNLEKETNNGSFDEYFEGNRR